jgi:hypothetical protein
MWGKRQNSTDLFTTKRTTLQSAIHALGKLKISSTFAPVSDSINPSI